MVCSSLKHTKLCFPPGVLVRGDDRFLLVPCALRTVRNLLHTVSCVSFRGMKKTGSTSRPVLPCTAIYACTEFLSRPILARTYSAEVTGKAAISRIIAGAPFFRRSTMILYPPQKVKDFSFLLFLSFRRYPGGYDSFLCASLLREHFSKPAGPAGAWRFRRSSPP